MNVCACVCRQECKRAVACLHCVVSRCITLCCLVLCRVVAYCVVLWCVVSSPDFSGSRCADERHSAHALKAAPSDCQGGSQHLAGSRMGRKREGGNPTNWMPVKRALLANRTSLFVGSILIWRWVKTYGIPFWGRCTNQFGLF